MKIYSFANTGLLAAVLASGTLANSAMAVKITGSNPNQDSEICEIVELESDNNVLIETLQYPEILKRKETQLELCSVNFYDQYTNYKYDEKQDRLVVKKSKPVVICPKLRSTNPGTEVFTVTDKFVDQGNLKANMESACRNADLYLDKKLAKFKSSITCSYSPSILGYYHFALALGTNNVPAGVYRTMKLEEHQKVSALATSKGMATDLILTLWKQFARWENAATDSSSYKLKRIFHKNKPSTRMISGTLSENPRGELKYREIMGLKGGHSGSYRRILNFVNGSMFSDVRSITNSVGSIDGRVNWEERFVKFIQKFVRAQDVSAMVVLDGLFSQQDRYGNQHYYPTHYGLAVTPDNIPAPGQPLNGSAAKIVSVRAREYDKEKEGQETISQYLERVNSGLKVIKVVPNVKKLLLKDNDCGVVKTNHVIETKAYAKINHMPFDTYKRLVELSRQLIQREGIYHILEQGAKMTSTDLNKVRKNAHLIVGSLQTKCKNKAIKFDLQDDYLLQNDMHKDDGCLSDLPNPANF